MKKKNYYNLAGLALGAVFGYFAIKFLAPKMETLFYSVSRKMKNKQNQEGEKENDHEDDNEDGSGLNSFVEGFKESVEKVTVAGMEVE
jgi:hypothetical protein